MNLIRHLDWTHLRSPTSRLVLFTILASLTGLPGLARAEAPVFHWPDSREDVFDLDRWSVSFGVAYITKNTIDEVGLLRLNRARGPEGGEIYLFGLSYTLRDFDGERYRWMRNPQLDVVGVFGVVNERGSDPFHDYNLGLTLRWKDFPWNEFVYTNVESGVGFSYTEKIMAVERERHPTRSRSHLNFYWPLEIALAHPSHRQHQLIIFNHHQSGGRIFQKGGSNHIGLAYRYVFRER